MQDFKTMLFGTTQDALDKLDQCARLVAHLPQPSTNEHGQVFCSRDPEVLEAIRTDVQDMAMVFMNRHLLVTPR